MKKRATVQLKKAGGHGLKVERFLGGLRGGVLKPTNTLTNNQKSIRKYFEMM